MSKRAVILAGGKGTRLRPYTVVLPKPLMPIGEYPILEVIIRQLANAGFTQITLAVNHQAEIIKAFFNNGLGWGLNIDYSTEDQPLGTMGPLQKIQDLPENFLVMNGDVLTDLDFSLFYNQHVDSGRLFTISSMQRRHSIDYGVLEASEDNRLIGFHEKPTVDYNVSMGVYMMRRSVLNYIPRNQAYGFDDLMLRLIELDEPVHVNPFTGYWLDIGRPDDYVKAIEEYDSMKSRLLPNG